MKMASLVFPQIYTAYILKFDPEKETLLPLIINLGIPRPELNFIEPAVNV